VTEHEPVNTQDLHGDNDAEANLEEAGDSSCGLEFADRLSDGGFESERNEYCFYAHQNYKKGEQVNESLTEIAGIRKCKAWPKDIACLHNLLDVKISFCFYTIFSVFIVLGIVWLYKHKWYS